MKKCLLLAAMFPLMAFGFGLELGANTGNMVTTNVSIRFLNKLKLGVYYGAETMGGNYFGKAGTIFFNPKCITLDYYRHSKNHEYYLGVEAGPTQEFYQKDFSEYFKFSGPDMQTGVHFGYSHKLIKGFYINANIAYVVIDLGDTNSNSYRTMSNYNSTSALWITIGLHYIFKIS